MRWAIIALLVPMAACAGAPGERPAAFPPAAEDACRDDGLAAFIGRTADARTGTQMLQLSGARTLRWGAPGMAMTMDFRPDRLTVSYDDKMAIITARCG